MDVALPSHSSGRLLAAAPATTTLSSLDSPVAGLSAKPIITPQMCADYSHIFDQNIDLFNITPN